MTIPRMPERLPGKGLPKRPARPAALVAAAIAWMVASTMTPAMVRADEAQDGLPLRTPTPVLQISSLSYSGKNYRLRTEKGTGSPAADDHSVLVHRYAAVSLPERGKRLGISFGAPEGASRSPIRLRYKLEGYDSEWRDLTGSVHLVVKFHDENRVPVSSAEFRGSGKSVGWREDLANSKLSVRREQVTVPPRAAWMDIWIDSGGHDENAGVWIVDDLKVQDATSPTEVPKVLFEEGFEEGNDLEQEQGDFSRWVRDGGALGGARVLQGLPGRGDHALLLVDSSPVDYSAWRLKDRFLLPVVPGQKLSLEWSEVFSVGSGRAGWVSYEDLPAGNYQFRVREVDAMGDPTGEEALLPVIVAPPFHANVWFRVAAVLGVLALLLGVERLFTRAKMRRRLEILKRKEAVQQERARIARDIHDDLGTVLTRISMASESAALEAEPGSLQKRRMDEICDASRQLARTMEEIVWAQDPARDSTGNVADYFSSFAQDLCRAAGIACRLDIPMDLPDIPLEAERRHELFLVFKEVLNNIIKHAGATEARISLRLADHGLTLTIADNGRGFDGKTLPSSKGNGLKNLRNRLGRLNGRIEIRSEPAQGTRVEVFLPLLRAGETADPK